MWWCAGGVGGGGVGVTLLNVPVSRTKRRHSSSTYFHQYDSILQMLRKVSAAFVATINTAIPKLLAHAHNAHMLVLLILPPKHNAIFLSVQHENHKK